MRLATIALVTLLCGAAAAAPALPPITSDWDGAIIGDLANAMAKAEREHKPLAVFFVADWCNYCRAMKAEALADPRAARIRERSVFLVLDVERDDAYNNTKTLMLRLGVKEFPAFTVMQAGVVNPSVLGRVIGYHETNQFYGVLEQIYPPFAFHEIVPYTIVEGAEYPVPPGVVARRVPRPKVQDANPDRGETRPPTTVNPDIDDYLNGRNRNR